MTTLETAKREDDDYYLKVIKPGDDASDTYKKACVSANKDSFIGCNGMLQNGKIVVDSKRFFNKKIKLENQIDGVGTKVRIYMKQFESLYREYKNSKSEETLNKLLGGTMELMHRMLHDFFAMNADDLRDGEMALAITNIMDINHLDGEKGQIFGEAMARAMSKIIKETGIAIVSGETAILGESQNCNEVIALVRREIGELGFNLDYEKERMECSLTKIENIHLKGIIGEVLRGIAETRRIMDRITNGVSSITNQIEVNLGGSIVGMKLKNKLIPLRDGQVVIGFQEIPTGSGIMGPRSNGISAIRKIMEELLGFDWPNMTLNDLVDALPSRKPISMTTSNQGKFRILCEEIKNNNIKLGDIATGKTTIFNPFISRELLGGLEDSPEVGISRLIHVTGNPVKKIASAIGNQQFDIDIDLSEMPVPQIIRICQLVSGMSDEDAMKKFNMGLPYATICNKKDVEKIIQFATESGIIAKKVGTIRENKETEPVLNISGIGGSEEIRSYTISEVIK